MEIKKIKINAGTKKRKIYIIDNILSYNEIKSIYTSALESPFGFMQKSDGHNLIENTRFAYHITPEDSATRFKKLFRAQEKILKKLKIKNMRPADVYINIADAMTPTLPHTDRPEGCWTLLYYANFEWDFKWGGQTNFYNTTTGEIEIACVPKPGRFALFQADILHQATPPTFYCPYKRLTIPFKMDPAAPFDPNDPAGHGEGFPIQNSKVNNGITSPEYRESDSCWI